MKLWSTLAIVFNLFMARTFGDYITTIGGYGEPSRAIYKWRGVTWWVPTGSVK